MQVHVRLGFSVNTSDRTGWFRDRGRGTVDVEGLL